MLMVKSKPPGVMKRGKQVVPRRETPIGSGGFI